MKTIMLISRTLSTERTPPLTSFQSTVNIHTFSKLVLVVNLTQCRHKVEIVAQWDMRELNYLFGSRQLVDAVSVCRTASTNKNFKLRPRLT